MFLNLDAALLSNMYICLRVNRSMSNSLRPIRSWLSGVGTLVSLTCPRIDPLVFKFKVSLLTSGPTYRGRKKYVSDMSLD